MLSKVKISGLAVLFLGVAVLLFTFYNAYVFLFTASTVQESSDITSTFGAVLAPLIETCIKAIYLGIMGWIGSILTRRGVQAATYEKEEEKQKKAEKGVKAELETEEKKS